MVVIYGSMMVHYPCGKSNIVDECIDVRRAKVKQWQESLKPPQKKVKRSRLWLVNIEYQVTVPNIRWSPELWFICNTVWSERFLYKVAPPELKISPILYFVIHNSVVLSKKLKIVVPFWLLFVYVDYYQNNQFYRVKNRIFKILLLWHNNFQYFG